MSIHRPQWFRDDKVMISTAPTCGINKSGGSLVIFDPTTGVPTEEVDDRLLRDMQALVSGGSTETLQWVDTSEVEQSRPGSYLLRAPLPRRHRRGDEHPSVRRLLQRHAGGVGG